MRKNILKIKNEYTVEELINKKDVIKVATFNCADTVCDLFLDSTFHEDIEEGDILCSSYDFYCSFGDLYSYYDDGIIIDKYSVYNGSKWEEDRIDAYARYGVNTHNNQKIKSAVVRYIKNTLEYYKTCKMYDDEIKICFVALAVMNNKTYDLFYNKSKDEYYFIFDGLRDTYYTVENIDRLAYDFATKHNATASIVVGAGVEQIWIDFRSKKVGWTEEYKAYVEEQIKERQKNK